AFLALLAAGLFLWRAVFFRFVGQADADRLFRQVEDVAYGSFDGGAASQILVNRFRLSRRFDDDERTNHVAVLTPDLCAGRLRGEACVLLANAEEDARNGQNVSKADFALR